MAKENVIMGEATVKEILTMQIELNKLISMNQKVTTERSKTDDLINQVFEKQNETFKKICDEQFNNYSKLFEEKEKTFKELFEITLLQHGEIKSLKERVDELEGVLIDFVQEKATKKDKIKLIRYGIKGISE